MYVRSYLYVQLTHKADTSMANSPVHGNYLWVASVVFHLSGASFLSKNKYVMSHAVASYIVLVLLFMIKYASSYIAL